MTILKYRAPGLRYRVPDKSAFGRRFSDIMDDFFSDAVSVRQEGLRQDGFTPEVDFAETEKNYQIQIHLPGMKREDISVNLENGVLTISGERKWKDEEKKKTYHKIETRYGSFNRSIQLPDGVDADSVKAVYRDGILEISIDKDKEKVERKIQIT